MDRIALVVALLLAVPAHAGSPFNGPSWNGAWANGYGANGGAWANGPGLQGGYANGMTQQGKTLNGFPQGPTVNGYAGQGQLCNACYNGAGLGGVGLVAFGVRAVAGRLVFAE
jgi:hypothetical protein